MFVTSDIFDSSILSALPDWDRRELLVCGIDVHGMHWRGYEAAAQFMLAAAERCGLISEMKWAGYVPANNSRERNISPKSFEALAQGKLKGAREARSILFRGERASISGGRYNMTLGGIAGSIQARRGPTGPIPFAGPPWRFHADFLFPLDEESLETAADLFALSVDVLGAEYGYFFVRDEFCGALAYMHGMAAYLGHDPRVLEDMEEIGGWSDYSTEGRLWTERAWFRDLFAVNLLSERHANTPVEGLGLLHDWIAAEPGRGKIAALNQGRWLWTLTDAEMVAVRPRLNEAGLLLSCNPRVYRDLPGGGAASMSGAL
jgi:hypothetical protein